MLSSALSVPVALIVALQQPTAAMGEMAPSAQAIIGLMNGLVSSVTTPLALGVIILMYYNVRMRKEGYDLVLMAQGLVTAEEAGRPGLGSGVSGLGNGKGVSLGDAEGEEAEGRGFGSGVSGFGNGKGASLGDAGSEESERPGNADVAESAGGGEAEGAAAEEGPPEASPPHA